MKTIHIRLAQEQLEEIENLSGAGYDIDKIAMYLDVDRNQMRKEFSNPDSFVRYHYDRGILLVDAEAGIKLAENAKVGNITAHQQLMKIRAGQRLESLRKTIMYGEEIDGL